MTLTLDDLAVDTLEQLLQSEDEFSDENDTVEIQSEIALLSPEEKELRKQKKLANKRLRLICRTVYTGIRLDDVQQVLTGLTQFEFTTPIKDGHDALSLCVLNNRNSIFKRLIELGYDPTHVCPSGHSAAELIVIEGNMDLLELLISHGYALTGLLHAAATMDRVQVLSRLLEGDFGLTVDEVNEAGQTALHCACLAGHIRAVSYLIEHGANINLTTYRSLSPMHYASLGGNAEVIQLLQRNGAVTDRMTGSGLLPLTFSQLHNRPSSEAALRTSPYKSPPQRR